MDRTPAQNVSLQSYTDSACKALNACDGKVHLVGHSMAGAVITQAAEAMPEKIPSLVYLSAFLLPEERSLFEELQGAPSSILLDALVYSADQSEVSLDLQSVRDIFYADCSAADLELAQALLVPQATAPLATPIQTTDGRWGRIPRHYIECTEDQAIGLSTQRAMHARLPCEKVFSMKTGHSPFLSVPGILADHLLSIQA